jgi:hypothetical protein
MYVNIIALVKYIRRINRSKIYYALMLLAEGNEISVNCGINLLMNRQKNCRLNGVIFKVI